MVRVYTYMSLIAALAVTACSSTPYESPIYAHNPVIGGSANTQAAGYAQHVNASYNNASYNGSPTSTRDQECLKRETNRELIGGAVGGTVGAFAGRELIGGTKGVVAGAALGGIAGYGIGDISTNCAPKSPSYSNTASSNTTYSNPSYQSAPGFAATPANFSCPTGTAAQSNGTCMLNDSSISSASYLAGRTQAAPASVSRRYEPVPQTRPAINARTLATPSPQYRTEVTQSYGASPYLVQQGDTVYSLANKLCVSVSDIQGSNGLDSNYGIQIGQTLQLPSNRC